jgi:hypothetical protein
MAELLYNRLLPSFPHHGFISLLDAQGSLGTPFQQKLGDLLKQLGRTDVDRSLSAPALFKQLQEFIADKPVLLVVDDVRTAQQLDAILPAQLGTGSHLVITSRHSSLPESSTFRVSTFSFLL